ncbi:MAG: hypothetical protein OEZ65_03235 [Gemmatimonadota bacterium]|nr:hypothetical protein [Gemmatimonadota bacterium]
MKITSNTSRAIGGLTGSPRTSRPKKADATTSGAADVAAVRGLLSQDPTLAVTVEAAAARASTYTAAMRNLEAIESYLSGLA